MESVTNQIIGFLLFALNIVAAIAVSIHAAIHKKQASTATIWISLAWLAPLTGPILYLVFGINRIHRSALSLKIKTDIFSHDPEIFNSPLIIKPETVKNRYPDIHLLNHLTTCISDRKLISGNKIQLLVNGDQAYPAMISAIYSAKRSVYLSSYIFNLDSAGQVFITALKHIHDKGVEVKILIDAAGVRYSPKNTIKALKKLGLDAQLFHPTPIPKRLGYANLRNHRKI